MRWFKVAAIGVGILIAFLVVGSVVGFILHAVTYLVIAALVVGAVAVAIKVARSGKQVSRKRAEREVREPDQSTAGRCPGPTSSPSPPRTRRTSTPGRAPRTSTTSWPGSSARWAPSRSSVIASSPRSACSRRPRFRRMRTRAAGRPAHHPHGELGRAADHGDRGGRVLRRDAVRRAVRAHLAGTESSRASSTPTGALRSMNLRHPQPLPQHVRFPAADAPAAPSRARRAARPRGARRTPPRWRARPRRGAPSPTAGAAPT